MKKTVLASVAALAFGTALAAAASDQPNKPKGQTTTVSQQNQIGIKTPFNVWVDGQYVFVVNMGNADWAGPLDVTATCTPVAPTTTCGSGFPGGKFQQHFATFPKGYGQLPTHNPGSQETSGAGWIAVFMGLPNGSYEIQGRAANNYSPETAITIAAPQGGISPHPSVVHVSPGAVQLAPTKTPTPSPRRP